MKIEIYKMFKLYVPVSFTINFVEIEILLYDIVLMLFILYKGINLVGG